MRRAGESEEWDAAAFDAALRRLDRSDALALAGPRARLPLGGVRRHEVAGLHVGDELVIEVLHLVRRPLRFEAARGRAAERREEGGDRHVELLQHGVDLLLHLLVAARVADQVARERADLAWRLRAVGQGALISRCLVAVDGATGRPCHVQWLTEGYSDAIRVAAALPALSLDEALLESAYTPPAYRRLGIMAAVTALGADLAAKRGLRYALAFIERDNLEPIHQITGIAASTKASANSRRRRRSASIPEKNSSRGAITARRRLAEPAVAIDRNAAT